MKTLTVVFLIAILLGATLVVQTTFAKSKTDKKAEKAIDKAIGRAVEGKYSQIQIVNISKFGSNVTITAYNKSGTVTPPPRCLPSEHYDPVQKKCVPNPTPPVNGFKLCMAGDFSDSKVFDAMKKQCNFRVALGDMGYASDLSLVKKIAPDRAVCGNHDSQEDGSANIEKECLAYTGGSWWQKIGNYTLLLGFNTNGDTQKQLTAANLIIQQHSAGLKNIIALSHKNGHVFPNAHHPAEAKDLYVQLEQLVPQGIKLYEVSGHNHNLAESTTGLWFIAGAGGKSHYSCGTSAEWNYCDDSNYGFLQFTIDNQGTIAANFYDTNGGKIH